MAQNARNLQAHCQGAGDEYEQGLGQTGVKQIAHQRHRSKRQRDPPVALNIEKTVSNVIFNQFQS